MGLFVVGFDLDTGERWKLKDNVPFAVAAEDRRNGTVAGTELSVNLG